MPEWDRRVLEVLREPLESGEIHISRAARQSTFPARFQLIATMNPCPCGWLGHPTGRCHCTPDQVHRYRSRVSGALLDRIDMGIEVPAVDPEVLARGADAAGSPRSDSVRAEVCRARSLQQARQGRANACLEARDVQRWCAPDAQGSALLASAMARLSLSARSYHRVLKVARTIADLDGSAPVTMAHVSEALSYRHFDRAAA